MEGGRALLLHCAASAFFILSATVLYLNCAAGAVNHPFLLASACFAVASALLAWLRLLRIRSSRKGLPVRWSIGASQDTSRKFSRKCGKVAREGVVLFGNGDVYEGELSRGRCHGSGVYYFYAKGRYEGDWIDGKYEGHGIESWARGSQYLGQYRQGMRHGFGTYRFYEGDSYSGEWVGGQSHGCGVQSCSDDSFYAGEFKGGVKHGLGRYRFRNGDEYGGEYFGDKIHGFGVYKFANGHRYEGSWHEGRRQGFGTYTFWNGEARSGEWDNGTLRNRLQASDPAIKRAVEAARKFAEDAAKIPQMEEQVRKAVSAGNKAAIVARVIAMRAVQNQKEGKFCDINV
ncbi:phosphatidylinositol 4-phosphate 5-kinase 1-like [Zingiber officinale]|uniref:Uncharacterized protein n=1 Tax=Zingiber officinale TaxID=94328 RepID=A0A8J5BCA7_ZINOF|nr:phosphatidylinositol 4-phosphate 5-kinase 1-like [Zingiber officinale]KAG6468924.1 hypothetical protein ZIOFF_073619 [Zingiber officinale]